MSNIDLTETARNAILTKRGQIILGVLVALVVLTQVPGIRYSYYSTEDVRSMHRVDRLTGAINMCRFYETPTAEKSVSMICK